MHGYPSGKSRGEPTTPLPPPRNASGVVNSNFLPKFIKKNAI